MSKLNPGSNTFYPSSRVTNENVQSSLSATNSVQNRLMSTVLLSTVVFFIRDKYGNLQSVRGLLDAGSQSDIMTKECVNRLGLKQEKINVTISCLDNTSMSVTKFVHNCKPGNEKRSGRLTGTEIAFAEQILVKFAQTSEFSKEFNALKAAGEVNADIQFIIAVSLAEQLFTSFSGEKKLYILSLSEIE
ncbi:hypothetical protein NPIL_635181 [Nephila pilipes]|uniref:Peptidase aspartic putative domain-containing protein n=1 Tax=Nephila pilipes TaxID=299642 RepID=A0A8X6TR51_NEPPI|nr:hypothetical protein NPIL_635181 [Nephila pilipes]